MTKRLLALIAIVCAVFFNTNTAFSSGNDQENFKKDDVINIMEKVADWQINHFEERGGHDLEWTKATLYAGMMDLAKMSDNEKYLNWLYDIGREYLWQPHVRMYMADDIVISQMFLEMYRLKGDKRMLNPTMARTDWVVSHPSTNSLCLNYANYETLERWSWCDALFMAPPVYAQMYTITGDSKYLIFMDSEFKATYDYLYDKEEKLFYRDCNFFDKREANGEKIFWGRGNGWVMGGLVKVLQELPEDSNFRQFYVDLFVEMSEKIIEIQGKDGCWHASLLDPESYPSPETSSSGFFTYALAYGINNGLLDRERYISHVTDGWNALVNAVYPDGKLGWVQPVGQDPKHTTQEMTDVYGIGAFLMAGSEIYKLVE